MKNTLKMFGIIAIATVIGFWAVSCGDDDGGGSGSSAISGNAITSGAEVVYDSSIKDVAEAKKVTDFSYTFTYDSEINPLSYFFDGSPSVTISDNKVTINLGIPKPDYLVNISGDREIPGVLTVNPKNAKGCEFIYFQTSDGKYNLLCMKDDGNNAELIYVDRDVTMKGTITDEDYGNKKTYNASLKKGWNYGIIAYNKTTNTTTFTSSTTLPGDFKWIVIDDNYWYNH